MIFCTTSRLLVPLYFLRCDNYPRKSSQLSGKSPKNFLDRIFVDLQTAVSLRHLIWSQWRIETLWRFQLSKSPDISRLHDFVHSIADCNRLSQGISPNSGSSGRPVLRNLHFHFQIDDVLVAFSSVSVHLGHPVCVFQRLPETELVLNVFYNRRWDSSATL